LSRFIPAHDVLPVRLRIHFQGSLRQFDAPLAARLDYNDGVGYQLSVAGDSRCFDAAGILGATRSASDAETGDR
jgi:hypothetical protein